VWNISNILWVMEFSDLRYITHYHTHYPPLHTHITHMNYTFHHWQGLKYVHISHLIRHWLYNLETITLPSNTQKFWEIICWVIKLPHQHQLILLQPSTNGAIRQPRGLGLSFPNWNKKITEIFSLWEPCTKSSSKHIWNYSHESLMDSSNEQLWDVNNMLQKYLKMVMQFEG
jgi:hypothetical protein